MTTPQAMFNIFKNSNNPKAFLDQLILQNPQMKSAVDYINANGGNPQQAFYKLAKERGTDPTQILNTFK